jgi:putative endonuclease
LKTYYVYIMADRHRGALYTGMTDNWERRVSEHKSGFVEGLTK